MKIFDTYCPMKNKEGYTDINEEMIDTLDEMLTANGIEHCFTLPHTTQDNFDDTVVNVCYSSEDDTMFFLTYATFCMKHRNAPAEAIEKAMLKHLAK